MKTAVTIVILFVLGIAAGFFVIQKQEISVSPDPTPQPSASAPTFEPDATVAYKDKSFAVHIQEIENPKTLTLVPNFTPKKSSQDIVLENNCVYGVNGGFYTPEKKPLGLFVVDGKILAETNDKSTLINGFFYKDKKGKLHLSNTPPNIAVDFALQSGPYFTPESKLKIVNDKYARRIIVGKTDYNKFYFLALTEIENTHSGPLLSDLPEIIRKLNKELYNILLNLDGGTASAFYSNKETKLPELTTVGSFLCGK